MSEIVRKANVELQKKGMNLEKALEKYLKVREDR